MWRAAETADVRPALASVTPPWQPYREPLAVTLRRAGAIAVVGGAALAASIGGLRRWPLDSALVLWVALGGHWIELCFLNGLRPRIAAARHVQIAVRMAVWFAGGVVLGVAMALTARLVGYAPPRWPAWWVPGAGFIAIELVVHLGLQLLGRPNFFDGRG